MKEFKAALAAPKDAYAIAAYEGADITKMHTASCLKATGKTVMVL